VGRLVRGSGARTAAFRVFAFTRGTSPRDVGVHMKIEVECYSGYRGEESPRSFRIADRKIEISEVSDRWISPDHRYFKVIGEDGDTYILRHETETWTWELTYFRRNDSSKESS
jgi:hypothetical protein